MSEQMHLFVHKTGNGAFGRPLYAVHTYDTYAGVGGHRIMDDLTLERVCHWVFECNPPTLESIGDGMWRFIATIPGSTVKATGITHSKQHAALLGLQAIAEAHNAKDDMADADLLISAAPNVLPAKLRAHLRCLYAVGFFLPWILIALSRSNEANALMLMFFIGGISSAYCMLRMLGISVFEDE